MSLNELCGPKLRVELPIVYSARKYHFEKELGAGIAVGLTRVDSAKSIAS